MTSESLEAPAGRVRPYVVVSTARAFVVACATLAVAFSLAPPVDASAPVVESASSADLADERGGGPLADEPPAVEAKDVYFGNGARYKKPAQVDPDAVYAEIPEYKKILEDELEPADPKYQLLMNKASRKFVAAVRKVARADGYDLVARQGALDAEDVPDVTQSVIDRL